MTSSFREARAICASGMTRFVNVSHVTRFWRHCALELPGVIVALIMPGLVFAVMTLLYIVMSQSA